MHRIIHNQLNSIMEVIQIVREVDDLNTLLQSIREGVNEEHLASVKSIDGKKRKNLPLPSDKVNKFGRHGKVSKNADSSNTRSDDFLKANALSTDKRVKNVNLRSNSKRLALYDESIKISINNGDSRILEDDDYYYEEVEVKSEVSGGVRFGLQERFPQSKKTSSTSAIELGIEPSKSNSIAYTFSKEKRACDSSVSLLAKEQNSAMERNVEIDFLSSRPRTTLHCSIPPINPDLIAEN